MLITAFKMYIKSKHIFRT